MSNLCLTLETYYLLLLPFPCMDWVLFLDGGHLLTCSHNEIKLRLHKAQPRGELRRVKKGERGDQFLEGKLTLNIRRFILGLGL